MTKNTYTLFELNEHIKQVLALNFDDSLWINCEIHQINHSRGHHYIELIEKEANKDKVIAQSQAIIWYGVFQKLKISIGSVLSTILQVGMSVKILVRVDFSERYGLKLLIEDIDPTYTIGQAELKRQELFVKIQQAAWRNNNKQLRLPMVLQRIAVLSAKQAAGLQDYLTQTEQNPYQYQFRQEFFEIAVQGKFVWSTIKQQLQLIDKQSHRYDVVIIIRGGGSRLDLAAFDDYELCQLVAKFPLPILVGIGHETDSTALDLVAHKSLKTPTAVADYLLQHNAMYEGHTQEMVYHIQQLVQRQLRDTQLLLEQQQQTISFLIKQQVQKTAYKLDTTESKINYLIQQLVQTEEAHLKHIETLLAVLSPKATLERGYSLTTKAGKIIKNKIEVTKNDQLLTYLKDGKIISVVKD